MGLRLAMLRRPGQATSMRFFEVFSPLEHPRPPTVSGARTPGSGIIREKILGAIMRIRLRHLVFAAVAALPAVTWAGFKPIRVLAPQLTGIHCLDNGICIDDLDRLPEAVALRDEAVGFVASRLGRIGRVPKFVFCAGAECAQRFGFTYQGAYHVGTFGVVIGPRGWQSHFARHELIHHVQMENIGSWHALLFTPTWFIEGMAYSLSDDPRRPLPEPLEGWRSQFEGWYPDVPGQDLWAIARGL